MPYLDFQSEKEIVLKTVVMILNRGGKKDNPDKIPVPDKKPEIIPPHEPQPDVWPKKEPEIKPGEEPLTIPPVPPKIPFPGKDQYRSSHYLLCNF